MSVKDEILKLQDLKPVAVQVPEWSAKIYVRPLTLQERFEFEELGKQGRTDFVMALIIKAACDQSGNPLFTAKDIEALKAKNSVALIRIFTAATRLNGLTAADIEDLEKNSQETQDAGSPSD